MGKPQKSQKAGKAGAIAKASSVKSKDLGQFDLETADEFEDIPPAKDLPEEAFIVTKGSLRGEVLEEDELVESEEAGDDDQEEGIDEELEEETEEESAEETDEGDTEEEEDEVLSYFKAQEGGSQKGKKGKAAPAKDAPDVDEVRDVVRRMGLRPEDLFPSSSYQVTPQYQPQPAQTAEIGKPKFTHEFLGYENEADMDESDKRLLKVMNETVGSLHDEVTTLKEQLGTVSNQTNKFRARELQDEYYQAVDEHGLGPVVDVLKGNNNGKDPVMVLSQAVFEFAQNRRDNNPAFAGFTIGDAVNEIAYLLNNVSTPGADRLPAEVKAEIVREYLVGQAKKTGKTDRGRGPVKARIPEKGNNVISLRGGEIDKDGTKKGLKKLFGL